MPSMTVTATAQQWARFLPALDKTFDREEGESDAAFYRRWLREVHTEVVFAVENREQAPARDPDIINVTTQ